MIALTLAALALAPLPPQQATRSDDPLSQVEIGWKGKTYAGPALPLEVGPGPPAAAEAWAAWTLEHDYRMTLTDDARVLLITHQKNGKFGRQLELVHRTEKEFDRILPEPEREEEVVEEEVPEDPTGELPEDPDGGPAGWTPEGLEPLPYTYSYEWGVGTWKVDTETCVMFIVRDEEDYGDLVETLGEMQDYLKPWVEKGKTFTGFVHERPMVAAYIANASGQEEWDPDNELVHRVAQMLFVRRFSSFQPYWLAQGLAWHIENELRGAIYCFPYRSEFVWATEHTGWDKELKSRFKDRDDQPLQASEFATWKRGKYEAEFARVAFGFAGFFDRYHQEDLSPFCEEVRLFAIEDNKVDLGDGNWERVTDYQVSIEDQLLFLKKHFGDEVLEDVTGYFAKGKRFKLSR